MNFDFESTLEANGFDDEEVLGQHLILKTNGYSINIRSFGDQIVVVFQDWEDNGFLQIELVDRPKSPKEFLKLLKFIKEVING